MHLYIEFLLLVIIFVLLNVYILMLTLIFKIATRVMPLPLPTPGPTLADITSQASSTYIPPHGSIPIYSYSVSSNLK